MTGSFSRRARRWTRCTAAALALLFAIGQTPAFAAKDKGRDEPAQSLPVTSSKALVLYDTTGDWGHLGELYGTMVANLLGRFGGYAAHPVRTYTAGELKRYAATIYIGSTYDEPLPDALLTDVLATDRQQPVVWMHDNIWQLAAKAPDFTERFGWNWAGFDTSDVSKVVYKGTTLSRSLLNTGGIMNYTAVDPSKVTVLAEAQRADGTRFPWALRSNGLTYMGEIPFAYTSESDRAMIFADLLFDVLAPKTAARHRALVRLEDIGPDADPAELMAAADYLASAKVPFSFGVYSVYNDPRGVLSGGVPQKVRLRDRPQVVAAIKYLIAKGGTMLMHGYTHQYSNVDNPYNGVSADDFEFFLAHVDPETDNVVMDGPVTEDSTKWALSRVSDATSEFKAAKLPVPTIFEFPHYAASAVDYRAIGTVFNTRYERSLYFSGVLSGTTVNPSRYVGQFFPYVVTDVYGTKVIPENLGNYEPEAYNNHPPRMPADMVATAKQNLVVRDGFASFFFHPYYDVSALRETVEGIRAAGYTFVSPTSL